MSLCWNHIYASSLWDASLLKLSRGSFSNLCSFWSNWFINLLLYNAELASGSFPQSPVPHIHFDTLTYQSYKLRLLLFDVASQLLNALLPRSVSCTVEKRYCTDLTPFLSPLFLLENPILLHSSFLQKVDM